MDIERIRFLRKKLRQLERQNWNSFVNQEGCCGLTLPQCHTLLEIGDKPEVSLADLAASLGLDTSTLSRTIQGLVVIGLVNRTIDDRGRRFVTISLTGQGRKVYDEIEQLYNSYFGRVLDYIPSKKRKAVLESIGSSIRPPDAVGNGPNDEKRFASVVSRCVS